MGVCVCVCVRMRLCWVRVSLCVRVSVLVCVYFTVCAGLRLSTTDEEACFPRFVAGGHTASNAPDLFRTPKLSGAGPG